MTFWNGPTTGLWTDASRWLGSIPNGIGSSAEFVSLVPAVAFAVVIPNATSITVSSLNVKFGSTGSITIQGPVGSGTGTLIFDSETAFATMYLDLTASSYFQLGRDELLNVELATQLTVNVVNSGSNANIVAPVLGTGMLVKEGSGALSLYGTNSFSGGIAVLDGTLFAFNDAALGSGSVSLGAGGAFRSAGLIDNDILMIAATLGSSTDATIYGSAVTPLVLSGGLFHLSDRTLTFGGAYFGDVIIASMSAIINLPTASVAPTYRIDLGTLRFGNEFSARFLLATNSIGLVRIENGGTVDTAGFAATIDNLYMDTGSLLLSSSGVLDVTVYDSHGPSIAVHGGTIQGTAGADRLEVFVEDNFSLIGMTFSNWTNNTDWITINGSNADNSLHGSNRSDIIYGNAGNDFVQSWGGADAIYGGDGNDLINVQASSLGSSVDGGAGIDRLVVSGGAILSAVAGFEELSFISTSSGSSLTISGTEFVSGFALNTVIDGQGTLIVNMTPSASPQSLVARGFTLLAGASLDLTVNGSSGTDLIKGLLAGSNSLHGGDGLDSLVGGQFADTITGGNGNDKIRGDGGADILTGGAGADVFKFRKVSDSTTATPDTITDYLGGIDRLNFSRIDANSAIAGDQAFTYRGTGAFLVNGGAQIRWADLGDDLRVEVDIDGNGLADMHVLLQGAGTQTLSIADFVL